MSEYQEFENKQMMKDVKSFARKSKVPENVVHEILVQYMMDTAVVTMNYLQKKLEPLGLGLIARTEAIKDIMSWCIEMYAKYTREED